MVNNEIVTDEVVNNEIENNEVVTNQVVNNYIEKDYPLQTGWKTWFHHPKDHNWDLDSYQMLYFFKTVFGFWRLYMKHPKLDQGLFFLMRENIKPIWEDEHNRKGGSYSFKINKNKMNDIWKLLSMGLIGETICKESENINGMSIHTKYNCAIIKIWIYDCDIPIRLHTDFNCVDINKAIFKKHDIK